MSFVKHGDDQPITMTYDGDGKKLKCSLCKKPIVMVVVDEVIRPVCACEQIEKQEP